MALFQTLLKQSGDIKDTRMAAQMYFKENGGENMDKNPSYNLGFLQRKELFKESSSVTMEGPLCVDMCTTQRYILCNTPVEITLFRSRPEFVIQSHTEHQYKLCIQEIRLKASFLDVHPGVIQGHSEALKAGANALYPFIRSDCRTFNIAQGSRSFSFDNIFNSTYPQRIIAAFVSSESFSGKWELNPFRLQHYDLSQIELTVDGNSVPGRPLNCSFDDKGRNSVELFWRMYDVVGASNNPLFSNGLTPKDFNEGHSLMCFPLNGANMESSFLEVRRSANVGIQGTFSKALTESVTLILYAEWASVIEIDASRNVIIH